MRDRDRVGEKTNPNRVWIPYYQLEEFKSGMWKMVHSEETQNRMIADAIVLLRSEDRFSLALTRVIGEWPNSCLAEFTSPGNHLAWLGQAACCIELGIPESLTRRAWWKLTEEERISANRIASDARDSWQGKAIKKQLSLGV